MAYELYVRGFSDTTSALDLRNFLGCNEVTKVQIISDRITKKRKGYAFVRTRDEKSANIVKRKNKTEFGGRILEVSDSRKERKKNRRNQCREVEIKCVDVKVGVWKSHGLVFRMDYPLNSEVFSEEPSVAEENTFFKPDDVNERKLDSLYPGLFEMLRSGLWSLSQELLKYDSSSRIHEDDFSDLHPFTLVFCGRRKKKIRFQVIHLRKKYYVDIRTAYIETIWIKDNTLVLSLSNPPFIFKAVTHFSYDSLEEREVRHTDISNPNLLGQNNIFIFKISPPYFRALQLQIQDIQMEITSFENEIWSYTSPLKITGEGQSFLTSLDRKLKRYFRNKDVGYLIHACLSQRIFNTFHLHDSFLEELRKNEDDSISYLGEVFYSETDDDCYDEQLRFITNPLESFDKWRKNRNTPSSRKDNITSTNVVKVKRILVTPLRIIYIPEEMDIGNSVIRKYGKYIKNFCRVSFVDEIQREMKIRHTEAISSRIKRVLLNGIKVGRYHFKFLAFSTSQLRGGSLWMFHEEKKRDYPRMTCEQIRRWMGDFSEIHNLAKYCARLGQCFSTTRSTVDLEKDEYEVIADEKTWDGKYIFTDGCGMISRSLARKIVHNKLKIREYRGDEDDRLPGAFQIRFNGAKGVVAVYPDDSPTFLQKQRRKKLILRESMMKFKCTTQFNLGIIRYSNFRPCYMNRQVIALLSTRGIDDLVFLSFQKEMIIMLEEMFYHDDIAIEVLSKFSSNNELSRMLIGMIRSGFSVKEVPFIQNCLTSISKYSTLDLKQKSKIYVENGSLMIGVCDESKKLRYGQCFVRTEKKTSDGLSTYIHTGPVTVSKNPAFHPGDIRVLHAVDVPELRHLSNVIVFPVRGRRDHPNEISGSDLDGDIYWVCWERSLIPMNENFDPMDYTPEKAKTQLGRIANAHLAHYAFSPQKCLDPICKELSRLHSIAVDFPKTGVPADMPFSLQPQKFPLFMEKEESKHSQRSECVVEKLYEMITLRDRNEDDTQNLFFSAMDEDLVISGYEKYIKEAIEIYHEYAGEVELIMRKHRIRHESDLYSFFFIKYNRKILPERQMKEVKESLKKLVSRYSQIFHDGVVSTDDAIPLELYRKASSWYYASWIEVNKKKKTEKSRRRKYKYRKKKKHRFDFTVSGFVYFVCWRYLCEIKTRKEKNV